MFAKSLVLLVPFCGTHSFEAKPPRPNLWTLTPDLIRRRFLPHLPRRKGFLVMQRSLRAVLNRRIILSSLVAICVMVLFATLRLVQSATPQETKRSFESRIPSHVPLKFRIKKDEEKALDLDNKNWFRDIEIEVTNTSDKPIYFLSLNVEMPDLQPDHAGAMKVLPLSYGRGEFFEQNTKPWPDDIPIAPKATHIFVFDENQMVGYENWRTRNNRTDPVKLQVSMNHLSYGDGTGFTTLGAIPFPSRN